MVNTPIALSEKDFTGHPEVKTCLESLNKIFSKENPLIVSDVLDATGNQYAHLVQKGGECLVWPWWVICIFWK